jgi:hypothetical protein
MVEMDRYLFMRLDFSFCFIGIAIDLYQERTSWGMFENGDPH